LSARRVKLDGPKQVVQIGDGQRHLPICLGCVDGIINATGAISNREFSVETQMDKHAGIL
jgi:hypothetical protein